MTTPRTPARALAVATIVIGCIALAACGGSDSGESGGSGGSSTSETAAPTTTTLGTGDGTFEMTTETFTDPSRPTGDTPGRELSTDIYVPNGDGPFPLIVHSHGLDGSSAKFTQLLGAWASAGYVVVAPNFPLTNSDVPRERRSINDVLNQPADVSFVLDQVLAMDAPGEPLENKISQDHLGVSGLSLGGATTYPLLFHPCCREERFRSAALMSALRVDIAGGDYDWTRRFPVLVFAGTANLAVRYEAQQQIIANLPGPTWSVTLDGGLHAPPFENPESPHDEVVTTTTLDFWAATLRNDADAQARIATDATVPGVSSVVVTP